MTGEYGGANNHDELAAKGAALVLECLNAGGFPGRAYGELMTRGASWIQTALDAERAGRWKPSARTANLLSVLAGLVAAGPTGRWQPKGFDRLPLHSLDQALTARLAAPAPAAQASTRPW